jgi:hypothetical protein
MWRKFFAFAVADDARSVRVAVRGCNLTLHVCLGAMRKRHPLKFYPRTQYVRFQRIYILLEDAQRFGEFIEGS